MSQTINYTVRVTLDNKTAFTADYKSHEDHVAAEKFQDKVIEYAGMSSRYSMKIRITFLSYTGHRAEDAKVIKDLTINSAIKSF